MSLGNFRVAAVAGLLFSIQVLIIKYLDRSIHICALLCRKIENSTNQFREETFIHITTVKNFGCERERAQLFQERLYEEQNGRAQLVQLRAIRNGVMKLFYAVAAPIIIYVGIDQTSR
jgi:ABC-type multidrug transport system fused ATPase/permease subunit